MDIHTHQRPSVLFGAKVGLILLLAAFGNAHANGTTPTAQGRDTVSASATVTFRIVIPETIRIGRVQQRQSLSAPTTSHTVTVVEGRQLVTVARP